MARTAVHTLTIPAEKTVAKGGASDWLNATGKITTESVTNSEQHCTASDGVDLAHGQNVFQSTLARRGFVWRMLVRTPGKATEHSYRFLSNSECYNCTGHRKQPQGVVSKIELKGQPYESTGGRNAASRSCIK